MVETSAVGVRLLGPVDVTIQGAPRRLSGLRRKAVLAVLGLHPGEVLSSDRIVNIVWGERPPATVLSALQNCVGHLRGLLGDRSRIVTSATGYALDLPADAIDVGRAESLILESRADTEPAGRAAVLGTALDLWRGVSLSDVLEVPWLAEQSRRLERLRANASALLIDVRMALGEHTQLVSELERLIDAHPFQEDLHRQLILALYRCGRTEAALAAYQRLRRVLIDELGIEPSPALRDLEVAILRQDPGLDLDLPVPLSAEGAAPSIATTPAELPHGPRTFTGRAAELAGLDAALVAAEPMNTVVVVVSGTAGVGKTALAMHWANGVKAAFPDGQLYVNLRGFDPAGPAGQSGEVLHGFLRALGVPAGDIPVTLDGKGALYRTILTGRRILIVLDNAYDEDHVRPLLPGSSGGLVLVTSRNRLTGLVVAEGARSLRLDLPSIDEARAILVQRLGARRVAAEPAAVDAIIARCARLPLALAVAAAHSAANPGFPLAGLADQLRDDTSALEPFRSGDTATDVRTVFSWSYHALSEPAARLFRRLGVCLTSPDFTLAAAASLVGLPPRQSQPLLAELIRMNLLTELSPDRYGSHDLLRAFAAELAASIDSAADRSAALDRLLNHYLHTALAAGLRLRPGAETIALPDIQPGVSVTEPADVRAATRWFDTTLSALSAVLRPVPETPAWRPWQLAWFLIPYFDQQARWGDYLAAFSAALAAAEEAGDTMGQANAHLYLARAHHKMNRLGECRDHQQRAIRLFATIADPIGEARVLSDMAHVADVEGRTLDAVRHLERAVAVHHAAGHRPGEAYGLSNLGWLHLKLGNLDLALDLNERGLAAHVRLGDRRGQADTWNHLGRVHFRRGDRHRGRDSYDRAIAIYRELGFRFYEANSLAALGDDLAAVDDLDAARDCWQQAMALLDELHHAAAESVRKKLRAAR